MPLSCRDSSTPTPISIGRTAGRRAVAGLHRLVASGHCPPPPPDLGAEILTDIRTGIFECLRFGTTLLGDISADGPTGTSWKALPLRAIVFRELLGLTQERARLAELAAINWLDTHV